MSENVPIQEETSNIPAQNIAAPEFSDITEKQNVVPNPEPADINFDELDAAKALQPQQSGAKTITDQQRKEIELAIQLFKKKEQLSQQNQQLETKQQQDEANVQKQEDDILTQMPKSVRFHMPAAPRKDDEQDLNRFKNELVKILTSFTAVGSLTDLIVAKYSQNTVEIPIPPNITTLIQQISENKSYKEEKQRFMRSKSSKKSQMNFSSFNLSQSFSSLNKNYLENFSLMTDIGDVLLNYGQNSGFRATLPPQCQFQTLQQLVEAQMPRNAVGITIGLNGLQRFTKDVFIDQLVDQQQLLALFYRAVFLQQKYILDFCSLNCQSYIQQQQTIIDTPLIQFDFAECDAFHKNIGQEKINGFNNYSAGGSKLLNYFGFLIFTYLVAQFVIEQFKPHYLMEIPTFSNLSIVSQNPQSEEEDPDADNDNEQLTKNYNLAQENAGTRRMVQTLARECFATVAQGSSLNNSVKISPNASFARGWKTAYGFAAFMDCYVLRFARRYGVTLRSQFMSAYIQQYQGCEEVIRQYYQMLQKQFAASTKTQQMITIQQSFTLMHKIGIQKNFLEEYVIRNYTEYNADFAPCLRFDEWLNCLFVAANVAYCVHPYVQYLKTPVQRLEYAIKKLFDLVK